MPWLDEIKLGFGHSIIAQPPEAITMDKFMEARAERAKTEIESYGLFDTASPNFNTYYPDVTEEDLAPKDKDFVYPVFRALSEVTVHKLWNPVNFGQNGVLKRSMGLLKGQSVYANHEASVGNELGSVFEVAWEDSYKADGKVIPAGFNSRLKLDGKSNTKIVRAVMMDPPSIHSTSVTVQFMWEKSHASLTEEEFFRKLGTYDKDGKLIERIATDVKRYNEISLVAHGADPYAQKVGKDGKIVNPTFADNTYKLSETDKKNQLYFFFDYRDDIVQNTTIPIQSNRETENSENMNKTLALIAAVAMGIKFTLPKENNEANLEENDTALKAALSGLKLEDTAEVARLKEVETKFNAIKDKDIAGLEAFQTTTLTAIKTDVASLYNKLTDNKPDTAMVAMHEKADFEALQAFKNAYTTQLDAKYPARCKKCNSTEVSRQSAEQPGTPPTGAVQNTEDKLAEMVKSRLSSGVGVFSTINAPE